MLSIRVHVAKETILNVRIDTYAYSNRWRHIHPAEKGLFALLCLTASLLGRTPLIPLCIAVAMMLITVLGAGTPWREYLRLAALPALFLVWSCLALAISFSGGEQPLLNIPVLDLTISISQPGLLQAQLTLSRSLAAIFCLLFLALSTPMTEIMGQLRAIGTPRLLVELMTIAYRQLFIFLEISAQIKTAQEARLGYSSPRLAMKSIGGLAGNILIRSLASARQNHLGLLARGYDSELLFLSPQRTCSIYKLLAAAGVGITLIVLSLAIKP